ADNNIARTLRPRPPRAKTPPRHPGPNQEGVMKRLLIAGLALALLVPLFAFAQSAFNGTWETQLSSVKGMGKPLVIHLKDGMYECNCVPPVKIKADGEDHAVTGHPGYDSMAVTVVNDHAIHVVYKKDGKVMS